MTNEPFDKLKSESSQKYGFKKGCFITMLVFSGIIAIAFMFILFIIGSFIWGGTASSNGLTTKEPLREAYYSGTRNTTNKIALIYIDGIIMNANYSSWRNMTNADDICDELNKVAINKSIKAVILYIDSPGGEITATDKIYHFINKVKAANKPVIALLDSVAASGGYYIASNANFIIANRLTTTGSIGVIVDAYNFYNLLTKIGVKNEVYKSKELKDILNPARERTEKEKLVIQNIVNESYDEFVKVVSEGRITHNNKLTPQYIKNSEIGDGRIFSGAQATKLGLVDKLGYFEDAEQKATQLASLQKDSYKIITFSRQLSISEILQKVVCKNISFNVNIPGFEQNALLKPGKLYFLYTGF